LYHVFFRPKRMRTSRPVLLIAAFSSEHFAFMATKRLGGNRFGNVCPEPAARGFRKVTARIRLFRRLVRSDGRGRLLESGNLARRLRRLIVASCAEACHAAPPNPGRQIGLVAGASLHGPCWTRTSDLGIKSCRWGIRPVSGSLAFRVEIRGFLPPTGSAASAGTVGLWSPSWSRRLGHRRRSRRGRHGHKQPLARRHAGGRGCCALAAVSAVAPETSSNPEAEHQLSRSTGRVRLRQFSHERSAA
jgi:hypothetical protein